MAKRDFGELKTNIVFGWLSTYILGGSWKHKTHMWIPMGYTKKYPKFQIHRWPGSAASRLAIYTKKILKNTKEKLGNRIFQFLALKTLF